MPECQNDERSALRFDEGDGVKAIERTHEAIALDPIACKFPK